VLDFLSQLEDLVAKGDLQRTLRSSHRPCCRLVSFEDFCQDVVLRAVQQQKSFRGQSTAELAGWLRSIGQQLMVNTLRRSRHERHADLPAELSDPSVVPPAVQLGENEERSRQLTWLFRVLANLEPEERDLLLRHYYRREPFVEIARQLGVPPNTVVQRHARLLNRIRQQPLH
jgi:RNA polymerase sigma factor (sigma-70 family)